MGGHWPNRFRPRGNPLQAAMQSCRTYFDGGVSSSCAAIYSARRNRIASLCTYCSKNGLHSTEPPRLAQRPPGTAAGNHDVNRTHSTASKHPTPDQSDVQLLPEMFPRAVYIHMPFCMKRCHFCAFPVTLLPATPRYPPGSGSRPPDSQPRTGNFCSLSTKHDSSEPRTTSFRQGRCRDVSADLSKSFFRSIYFGGGSPSLIPPRLLQRVLAVLETEAHSLERSTTRGVPSSAVACRGRVQPNPLSTRLCIGTIDSKEHLEELAELGVTRFSVGVQTFDDTILKRLGRSNDRAANVRVLRLLSEIVREYARRGRKLSVSTDILLSFQRRDQLLEDLSWLVHHEFEHYEISSFARIDHHNDNSSYPKDTCDNVFKRQEIEQGYRCLHHEAYWRSEPFFGFGMGASSFVNLHRWTRPNRLEAYLEWVRGSLSRDGFFAATSTPIVLYKDPRQHHIADRGGEAGVRRADLGERYTINRESKQPESKATSNSKLRKGISQPSKDRAMTRRSDTPLRKEARCTFTYTGAINVETRAGKGNESNRSFELDRKLQQAPVPRVPRTHLQVTRCNSVGRTLQQIHYRLAVEAIVSALRTSEGVNLCALAEVDRMLCLPKLKHRLRLCPEEAVDESAITGELLRGVTEGVKTALLVGTADILVSGIHIGRPDKDCLVDQRLHGVEQSDDIAIDCANLNANEGLRLLVRPSEIACLQATPHEKPPICPTTTNKEVSQVRFGDFSTRLARSEEFSSRRASCTQNVDSLLAPILATLLRGRSRYASNSLTTKESMTSESEGLSARLHLRAPDGFLVSNDILSDILCSLDDYEDESRFST
ncbi:putative radical SAM domain containing protein [Neospora caninum Liverpool]|uniref:Putative radical SAM domain containing protein n=1 Tax=Neospora caninum (strain Liverpool) TaxID=572307 RepID=F0VBQ2_NEOCL|nr:putative radical SAM domain containing protein [Neospora caninum Liverpool]CBZ51036.1 putative radical SAM domain containing protein [Neospora caninum Liverpool]CEL68342.1 TPA: radical SAM domain containing protein, putative [Neospora caninum Liverpool]|eukprot:XP_003881069.1 putative radical SAM domain containing protein [Neospora caninum Liverpool]